jgi:hypothetical protein
MTSRPLRSFDEAQLTLSSPIPNNGSRLTFQRLSLAAVSGQRWHKHQ